MGSMHLGLDAFCNTTSGIELVTLSGLFAVCRSIISPTSKAISARTAPAVVGCVPAAQPAPASSLTGVGPGAVAGR